MTTIPMETPRPSSLADDVRAVRDIPTPSERRHIRRAARLSLAQLGRDIGVSSSAVWQWERAGWLPVTDNTVRYARLLDALRESAAPAEAA